MNDSKTVAIFGSGISGLSATHELAEKGWKVNIYEELMEPGGVARSYRKDSLSIPSEYSWRGYGPWYHNVFEMMKKIPFSDGKTVYQNISRHVDFVFTQNNGSFFGIFSKIDLLI